MNINVLSGFQLGEQWYMDVEYTACSCSYIYTPWLRFKGRLKNVYALGHAPARTETEDMNLEKVNVYSLIEERAP